MTDVAGQGAPAGPGQRRRRRRRRLLWITVGIAALVVVLIAAAVAVIIGQPVPPPLALPARPAAAPAGPLDGTWQVAPGSLAGFRLRESALGLSNDVVGRTSAVTGTIVISGGRVTAARLRIGLTAVRVSGKVRPQFARSLGTRADPAATFNLAGPVTLGPAFTSGATVTVRAAGQLAMHGISRLVTVSLAGRRSGPSLQVAGSVPVPLAAWRIRAPAGYGLLGSLASRGEAEFRLNLYRT